MRRTATQGTEDDVKVKFGGYLEEVFRQSVSEWTVHAELPLYPQSRETADLSIHRVRAEGLWVSQSDIVDSVIAVIEVKYANWNADYDFTKPRTRFKMIWPDWGRWGHIVKSTCCLWTSVAP